MLCSTNVNKISQKSQSYYGKLITLGFPKGEYENDNCLVELIDSELCKVGVFRRLYSFLPTTLAN